MTANKSKRSQGIDIAVMQKQQWIRAAKLSAGVTAATMMLAGCSDSTKGYVYESVDDCLMYHPGQLEICQSAYNEAVAEAMRTGPKFESQSECAANFGLSSCQQDSGGSFWMPFIAGYMVSEVIDEVGDYFEYKNRMKRYGNVASPVWSAKSNKNYVDASGSSLGKVGTRTMSSAGSSFDKKSTSTKATTKTMSRGGFGSTVAKSSSSSSRSSWGG